MRNIIRINLAVLFLFVSETLFAQATRTWVSGLGDDVNPASRTAPCKTFAGAISKTIAGGEINVLDPAGYGAVTITKSITIDGGSNFASILASATTGIIINAPGGIVTIRHLSINGTGTTFGVSGIKITSAKKVIIEDCVIANFSQKGIEINTADSCAVFLDRVTIHNAEDAVAVSTSSGSVVIDDCIFQVISNAGINLMKWQAVVTNSNLSDCRIAVLAQANTTVTLSANIITNNSIALQGPGKINSAGNNLMVANKVQGTAAIIKLQ